MINKKKLQLEKISRISKLMQHTKLLMYLKDQRNQLEYLRKFAVTKMNTEEQTTDNKSNDFSKVLIPNNVK